MTTGNLKFVLLKGMNRWMPRFVTDAYVLHFLNMPMKIVVNNQDFKELEQECTSYTNSRIVQLYIEDFKEAANTKLQINGRNQVFLSGMSIALSQDEKLNILDFGGSFGQEYLLLKSLGILQRINKYIICENSLVVEAFQKIYQNDEKVLYIDLLSRIPSDLQIHFVYLSGTLQYMTNPKDILDEIMKLRPQGLSINRIPVWDLPTQLTRQLRPRIGKEKERISYPCWVFNRNELIQRVQECGYDAIPLGVQQDQPYITGFGLLTYSSYLFKKKEIS